MLYTLELAEVADRGARSTIGSPEQGTMELCSMLTPEGLSRIYGVKYEYDKQVVKTTYDCLTWTANASDETRERERERERERG